MLYYAAVASPALLLLRLLFSRDVIEDAEDEFCSNIHTGMLDALMDAKIITRRKTRFGGRDLLLRAAAAATPAPPL